MQLHQHLSHRQPHAKARFCPFRRLIGLKEHMEKVGQYLRVDPLPMSRTVKTAVPARSANSILTVPPEGVNFNELLSKLMSICATRVSSADANRALSGS